MIKEHLPRVLRKSKVVSDGPPVAIENREVKGEAIVLDVSFRKDYWEKVETFLRQKVGSLTEREKGEAISVLLEYGAPKENAAKELTMTEKFAIGGMHSSLKFQMFECFQANRAIVVGLGVNLPLNRSLKKQIAALEGAGAVPHDEWDSWDEAKVNEYMNRYLFIK